MAVTLYATSNPGKASWSIGVAVAGRVTMDESQTKAVTIPAGLETASVFTDYVSEPNAYSLAGGLLNGSISGTTLTIDLGGTPSSAGCVVSYVIIGPA